MDGAEEVKDAGTDVEVQPSPKTDEQSPKAPEFTPEQQKWVEKLAHDKATAILAKKGDKAKTLEERVEAQTKMIEDLQRERLQITAEKYGLTVSQLEEAEITDPKKAEVFAKLFGGREVVRGEVIKPPKVDSGVTGGGGRMNWSEVETMNSKQVKELKDKYKVTELTELIDRGIVSPPKI